MTSATKVQFSYSNSIKTLINSRLFASQILHLSTLSNASNHSEIEQPTVEHQTHTKTINSLFTEITQILGASDVIPENSPTGFSLSNEAHLGKTEFGQQLACSGQSVRENAEQDNASLGKQNLNSLVDTHIRGSNDIDVNPLVKEIAEIIRAENEAVLMEEKLERLGFRYEPEVVEKVLKRCFKVPHLAYSFFNWVKKKDGFVHTTKTYNTMLYIAGEARQFAVVDKLVEEMERNGCEKDIKTWTILILHYGKARLTWKALLYFEDMKKCGCEPDEETYRTLVHSLCSAGRGEIALELYKEMLQKDMGLDLSLYKMLLNCVARLADSEAVNMVADDMIRISQVPERDVYLYLLKGFCVAGRIKEALELVRDLKNKDILMDYEYFETLVKGLSRADRISDALEILEIMKRRKLVDGKIYGIIINGYLRRKELSQALDLFQQMKEFGCSPTTSTCTELMQHLFGCNEYQRGCQLYNEMLESGIEIDTLAITTIVAAHVCQNNISDAWEVLKNMEDWGMKLTRKHYSILIKELCKVSSTDEIVKLLEKMQASRIFIHDELFQMVISYMEKKGDEHNVEIIKKMQKIYSLNSQEDDKSSNDVYKDSERHFNDNLHKCLPERMDSDLVKPLSKGYDEQDLKLIRQILSSPREWSGIEADLEKCSSQFTPELVVEVLRNSGMNGNAALRFFSWVRTRDGYFHTTETYNMAMKIAGRGKDFKHMRNLFHEMRRNNCSVTPDTWAIMIMQYGRTGLTELALKTFNDMKADGCKPTVSTFKYLIICLCEKKGRKVEEAINVFREMIFSGCIPDTELAETYLCCLCEAGNLSEARKCADSLCKVGFTFKHSYSLYIRALCRAGKVEEALTLLDKVGAEKTTLDRSTSSSIVHAFLRAGRLEEALAMVDSMKQEGIKPNVHIHTSLMVHYFKEKQIEKAVETFNNMKQDDCEPTIITYSALIRGYMKSERFGEAWSVFNDLKKNGPKPDFKTYSMFIDCLCKAGKSEEGMQLISEMSSNGITPSSVNFRAVMFGLNREGKQNLAKTVHQQKLAIMRNRKLLA